MTSPTAVRNVSSIITVAINKDQGENIGIYLAKNTFGKVVITKLAPNGVASQTALRTNMTLLTVNNVDCTCPTVDLQEIGLLLRETQGVLTIVAQEPELAPGTLVTAVVTKQTANESVGIGMGTSSTAPHHTIITSIKKDSLAYHSDLQVGMILRSVNNIDCRHKNPKQIATLLGSATGTFSILAQVKEEDFVPVAYATSATSPKKGERPPPPSCPAGGVWSKREYMGEKTTIAFIVGCLCFGIFGPLALCCPCDERDVYIVDDKIYTTDGQLFGHTKPNRAAGSGSKVGAARNNGRVR